LGFVVLLGNDPGAGDGALVKKQTGCGRNVSLRTFQFFICLVPNHLHGSYELISAAGERRDVGICAGMVVECLPQDRYALTEIVLIDECFRPDILQ
jgi:hypothetical protein